MTNTVLVTGGTGSVGFQSQRRGQPGTFCHQSHGHFWTSLGPELSSGFELLKRVLDGSMKAVPNITLGIVDVRDVADLHIRAMTNPAAKGQRFLALAGGIIVIA